MMEEENKKIISIFFRGVKLEWWIESSHITKGHLNYQSVYSVSCDLIKW